MTTIGLTAGRRRASGSSSVGLFALVGMVAAAQLSIAVAQILLAVAGALLARAAPDAPRAARGAGVLLAAARLRDADAARRRASRAIPVISVADCKQLSLFLLIPVVYDFARGPRARLLLTVVITIGAVSALVGVVQFARASTTTSSAGARRARCRTG